MSVIQSNASVTHTYGNVACLAMDYIMKFFDEDYFKKTHISTKLAHRQLNIYRSNIEFWKLQKPILIMRPRIEMNDSSTYFYGSTMINRMYGNRNPMEFANVIDLVKDREHGVKLSFLWNRAKIYYDVVIILGTMNEQLNLANFLQGYFIQDTPFMVNTNLESYVPKTAIYPMMDYMNIPRDNTSEVLQYLNTYGEVPFTYKLKNGSGNDEFFALYNTNVEMISSEISLDDGNTKGLISEDFTVSFTLSCEFNMMGFYYTFLNDENEKVIVTPHTDIDKDATVIPLFSFPINYELDVPIGWKVLTAPSFFVKGKEDSVELGNLIPLSLVEVFQYQKDMNMTRDTFFNFRVFKQRRELEEGVDFIIDDSNPSNVKITVYNCNARATYRLFVIVNSELINNMSSEMTEFYKEK